MRNSTKKPGFVLVLTLLILSALIVLVTSVYNRVVIYTKYSRVIKKREQAKALALSGVQCAIQSLENALNKKEENKEEKNKKEEKKSPLAQTFDLLNNWQTLDISSLSSIPDASIQWYMASELGKINLYNFYDAKNKKYKIDKKSSVDLGKMLLDLGEFGKKLEKELPEFLLKRSYEPQDLTEFLTIPALENLKDKLFLQKDGKPPFFMDLFSLHNGSHGINPFCLSVSLRNLLGFQESEKLSEEIQKNLISAIQRISSGSSLEAEWDKELVKIYGKSWKEIPENIKKMFTVEYEPFLFSVVSCARVGSITQKVYALVKPEPNQEADKTIKQFVIQQIYWI